MSRSGSITRFSMWSGPRNISTAMMRSFGNRPDCTAVDEPFYAFYLKETGLEHPMRDEVLASQPQNWQDVLSQMEDTLPEKTKILYLKHMTQHMLPQIDLSHMTEHTHCFLIRDPRLVIASFSQKWDQVDASSTGFQQQMELFEYFCQHSEKSPVIVEGEDIQNSPDDMLKKLCATCDIPFSDKMLGWSAGKKPEDGIWGAHWYNAVESSTGFAPYSPKEVELTSEQETLARQLEPIYLELKSGKLTL
ncbi:hypothetical protein A9Q83_09845 [Alphaproteobacteria bacterium 46_93_T64]|nr:hypothetical protein A9Q83_09845 [Alphaproteobacteria bacterium 46_93_T64]